jgi:hypothetical protein
VRINVAIPEAHVKKPVLDAALEAVTRLNEDLIRSGASPTSDQLIEAGAKWQPEPPGQEHFDHGALIKKRGHGDCDDWAPLHAATLRVTGEDPEAFAEVIKSGPKRWHAVVNRSNGTRDDPSRAAGMGGPGSGQAWGIHGAAVPLLFAPQTVHGVNGEVGTFIATPHLALRPVTDRHGQVEAWQARADLPWHGWEPGDTPMDVAMASLHQSPVSSQAVVGALRGALQIGISNEADPEHLKRLSAIEDACNGYPWEEIAATYGPDHADAAAQIVGGFFGKAFRGLKKLAKKAVSPLASAALSFVPGGSLVKTAFDMASPMLKKSVSKGKHLPPEQRAPMAPTGPSRPIAPGAPGAPGFAGGYMPWPYPLPYPVPWGGGWNQGAPASSARTSSPRTSSGRVPGAAWPPR